MNPNTFELLVNERFGQCWNILIEKGEEYATNDDQLHNFREVAKLRHTTMSDACLGMGMKHIISVIDIVRAISIGNALMTKAVIDKKIGDAINYLLLLEGCITEEMKEKGFWK